MTDIKQQFINEFKNELNGKDGFSENVITSFDEYFNEKLTQGSEKEVIDNSLSNGRFIRSDVMEAVNSVLYDKQNIEVITNFIGNFTKKEEYLNNQYTGYTTNDGKPLLVRIKNSNQTHYTADLIDVDGNVIYKIDSNKIKTQTNNNCCIHAFEQTLMLQDLVKFYHDNKITEPALKDFIEKTIEKLRKNKVFEKKEGDHFTKLRKEIYKIYALNKFLDSKETELKADGNYDKIKNYRNTLYNNLLNKESEVKFANYLDFKDGLEQYNNKVADIDKSIKTGDDSQLKKDKDVINILQFLNTTPTNLEDAKKCIECFDNLSNVNIDDLDNWKLQIFCEVASKYICETVPHENLLKNNLETVKKLYNIISKTNEIKDKLGNRFDNVEFNLTRATTYITELNKLAEVDDVGKLTNENIQKVYKEGNVVTDNNKNKYIFHKNNGNIKTDILAQLTSNNDKNNFDFINIKKDVYVKNQLTQEEFNEILNDDNFKTISKKVDKDANFLFYNKLKSLGIVSGDVSVNVDNFDFSANAQQMTLFPENSKYCLVDAGNGDDISGGGVNGACQNFLNKKFGIKVEDKVKSIHKLVNNKVVDCGNNCKAQCVLQDTNNKVTLLKFYKEEDGKQKDSIFILYATGPDFSIEYKEKINDGLQKLEGTLNSIMNTISNSSSTLSSTDTVIFGGISNAIFAGEYKDKKINNEFNIIDLFNALVYKTKSKEQQPRCNVLFSWGVGKAIDFIDELDKAGKEINIETDILDKFGFSKDDKAYKYLKTYIENNFDKIFSTAKKLGAPKPTEQYVSSASQSTPEHSTSSVSTPGSSTSSTSTLDASTSSTSTPGSSTPSQSTSDNSTQSHSEISTPSIGEGEGTSPSENEITENNVQSIADELLKQVQGFTDDDKKDKINRVIYDFFKQYDLLDVSSGKIKDDKRTGLDLVISIITSIQKKELTGKTPQEELYSDWGGNKPKTLLLSNLKKIKTNESTIKADESGKITVESVTSSKQPSNPSTTQNSSAPNSPKKPSQALSKPNSSKPPVSPKSTSQAPNRGGGDNKEIILKDLQNTVNKLKNKTSFGTFEIKKVNSASNDGLIDRLQKAKENGVELTEKIVNDIKQFWDKEVIINTKQRTIKEHIEDSGLLDYIESFSKEKEEEKQRLEQDITRSKNEIESIISEIESEIKKESQDKEKLEGKKKQLEELKNKFEIAIEKYKNDCNIKDVTTVGDVNVNKTIDNIKKTLQEVEKKLVADLPEGANVGPSQQQEQQTSNASAQGQNQPTNHPTNQQTEQQQGQQTEPKSNTTTKQKQQAKKAVGNKLNDKILPLMLMMQMMNKQGPGMNPMTMMLPMLMGGDNENGKINSMMMMLLMMNIRSGGMANNPLMMFMMMKMMMEDQKEKDSSKAAKTNKQLTNTSKNLEGATERLNEKRKEQFAIGG